METLVAGYRAVVSDLAFARSQGASENLVLRLNDLAGHAHGVLYASPAARLRGIVSFLFADFPRLFRATWRYTAAATLLFVIGWLAADYLIYTIPEIRENLIPVKLASSKSRRGEDVSFFTAPDPAQISSFIMTNNIREGMIAFAGGITFGALTVFTLVKNGLVIGAVVTMALGISEPVRLLSLLLPHGLIELTAIFICGGAGLMMGCALIAPGNLRRADAIRFAAGKALRLFAGTLPMFVVAAIIEGFITPSPIPALGKLAFAGLTAVGLVGYLGFGGRPTAPLAT